MIWSIVKGQSQNTRLGALGDDGAGVVLAPEDLDGRRDGRRRGAKRKECCVQDAGYVHDVGFLRIGMNTSSI